MRFHVFFILLLITITVNASEIGEKISDYFANDGVKELRELWNTQRKPFENAVASMLKRSYDLSLYVNNPDLNITSGYHVFDNIVHVFFKQMSLRERLVMLMPEVSFSLDHNIMRVECILRKFFIDASYDLYRNSSDIVHEIKPYLNSPFSYAQIPTKGSVTIVGTGCHMITQSIVQMAGVSLRVGTTSVKITKCQFTVEIFNDEYKMPPIASPYFSPQQSKDLQKVLANSQLEEITARLQGTLTSIVNTTGLFGLNMPRHRERQGRIITETANFMSKVARKMNMLTSNTLGQYDLDNVLIITDAGKNAKRLVLHKILKEGREGVAFDQMTINGLDSVYSTRRGGPCQLTSMRVFDAMRYNRLQVRGIMTIANVSNYDMYHFSGDLFDVGVIVMVDVNADDSVNRRRRGGKRKKNKRTNKNKKTNKKRKPKGSKGSKKNGRKVTVAAGVGVNRAQEEDELIDKETEQLMGEEMETEETVEEQLDDGDLDNENLANPEAFSKHRFEYRGWRRSKIVFSDFRNYSDYDKLSSLLTGVLHQIVPGVVMRHFSEVFDNAVTEVQKGKEGGYIKLFKEGSVENDNLENGLTDVEDDDDGDDENVEKLTDESDVGSGDNKVKLSGKPKDLVEVLYMSARSNNSKSH